MHGITSLTTGLPAVGIGTSAGAVLTVVIHAARIEHRPGTARSPLSVGALKFIGAKAR
jgi:hypothetical protein